MTKINSGLFLINCDCSPIIGDSPLTVHVTVTANKPIRNLKISGSNGQIATMNELNFVHPGRHQVIIVATDHDGQIANKTINIDVVGWEEEFGLGVLRQIGTAIPVAKLRRIHITKQPQ